MRFIRTLAALPAEARGAALAIGNFDGLHQGHQSLLARLKTVAQERGVKPAVMSFEPHPRRYFAPHLPVMRLMPFAQKARQLREFGIELFYCPRFNAALANLSAGDFIETILIQQLGVQALMTGADFRFGHDRLGDAALLAQYAPRHFYYEPFPLQGDDAVYSSTRIRRDVQQGNIPEVNRLLGRPYEWQRPVVHGEQRGRGLGYPTANFIPPHAALPPYGVYAVRLQIEGEGAWHDGIANFGTRPTFNGQSARLEVHLFDWQEQLYDKHCRIAFFAYIRPEKRFDGGEALRQQISKDCEKAKAWLDSN